MVSTHWGGGERWGSHSAAGWARGSSGPDGIDRARLPLGKGAAPFGVPAQLDDVLLTAAPTTDRVHRPQRIGGEPAALQQQPAPGTGDRVLDDPRRDQRRRPTARRREEICGRLAV